LKLESMQSQHQQAQFQQSYQNLPFATQAADIARQNLTNKANKAVLDNVYRQLFGL
jgi:hypothetical protein